MKILSKNSQQLAGLIKIIVIPVYNIKSIVNNSVQVNNTDQVFLIQCAIDSINHEADMHDEDNGTYYDHQVTAFVPGEHESNSEFDDLARHYVVLLLQTDNGSWIRLGDKSYPLKFLPKYSTQKPGYDLLFTGQLLYKSQPNVVPAY